MQQKLYKKYIETQLESYVHKHILNTNAHNDANITQVSAFHYVNTKTTWRYDLNLYRSGYEPDALPLIYFPHCVLVCV